MDDLFTYYFKQFSALSPEEAAAVRRFVEFAQKTAQENRVIGVERGEAVLFLNGDKAALPGLQPVSTLPTMRSVPITATQAAPVLGNADLPLAKSRAI